jgi:uncharacterized protein RhaS with RHS repeats
MQQRYYDPTAGRFLSVDPVVTDAGNGALFNRYMYAANNPFTLIDPDGRCTGSRITNSDGTCKSTGGFTTGTDGMAQGMQRDRAQAAAAPAGAANAPGGPYIEPTWGEIGAVAEGAATAASFTPLGVPLRAAKGVAPAIKAGAAGGATAGKPFAQAIRDAAKAENPLQVCVYCRREGVATQVDHAIPRARGGNATLDNAQLACPHCNASKGARDFPVNPPPGYRGEWLPSHWGP